MEDVEKMRRLTRHKSVCVLKWLQHIVEAFMLALGFWYLGSALLERLAR